MGRGKWYEKVQNSMSDIQTGSEMKAALTQLLMLANVNPSGEQITANDVLMAVCSIQSKLIAANNPVVASPPPSGNNGGSIPGLPSLDFDTPSPTSMPDSSFPSFDALNTPTDDFASGSAFSIDPSSPFANMAAQLHGLPSPGQLPSGPVKDILIVGELGIVSYQLKQALTKQRANVTIVKGLAEAVAEYDRQNYGGVLVDIVMPKEDEWLRVIREIRKLALAKGAKTEIVVLGAPVHEFGAQEVKNLAIHCGADYFIEKIGGWHKTVMDYLLAE